MGIYICYFLILYCHIVCGMWIWFWSFNRVHCQSEIILLITVLYLPHSWWISLVWHIKRLYCFKIQLEVILWYPPWQFWILTRSQEQHCWVVLSRYDKINTNSHARHGRGTPFSMMPWVSCHRNVHSPFKMSLRFKGNLRKVQKRKKNF